MRHFARTSVSIAAVALVLMGCAELSWQKPGVGRVELLADRQACRAERQKIARRTGRLWVVTSRDLETRCLARKGWILAPLS